MKPGDTFSHYRILRKIGQGGAGEVFLAEDALLHRKVALKFPSAAAPTDLSGRFLSEARSAASIDHPFICKVYETGEANGQNFIAFEFVQGQTLSEKLRVGRLPFEDALRIATEAAEGLAAAHQNGLIHRDIKPGNIMLTPSGHVKIMDFGLAKQLPVAAASGESTATAGMQTVEGVVVGTPTYMSPEQIRAEHAEASSDVFSLGLVFFEMFAGTHPFRKRTVQATMGAILHEEAPPLNAAAPALPAELGEIISRMLMKDAARRYSSAGELREDLARLQNRSMTTTSASSERAVAVLPFVDLSSERDQEYFCDGLAEELIAALSRLEGLKVISRTSSFRFRGAENDIRQLQHRLQVEAVLEGSVRKSGDRIRVVVKLIAADTGSLIWSERYDRRYNDVFEIQDEIAESVLDRLKFSLAGAPNTLGSSVAPPHNMRAYELYLKGRHYWNKRTEESLGRSIDYFQMALREDPEYALAFSGLAAAYATLALYGAARPDEVLPGARRAAERALSRESELPEALTVMGCFHSVYDWNWSAAERDFKRAIQVNPNYAAAYQWYAVHCLVPLRRFTEARTAIQRAHELDPLSVIVITTSGLLSYFQRQYEQAIGEYRQALEIEPDFGIAHYFLGQAYLENGLLDQGAAEFEQAARLTQRAPECVAMLGYARAKLGNRTGAAELAEALEEQATRRYISPVILAWIPLALEDRDKALYLLEQAVPVRATDLIWLRVRPIFDPLRNAPRFEAVCSQVGV